MPFGLAMKPNRMTRNVLFGALGAALVSTLLVVMLWPPTSYSGSDFDAAVYVAGQLAGATPLDVRMPRLDISQLGGFSRWRAAALEPLSKRARQGFGPNDFRQSQHRLTAPGTQLRITGFVISDRIAHIEVCYYGDKDAADAIVFVLRNWVPTASIRHEVKESKVPLWETTEAEPEAVEGVLIDSVLRAEVDEECR